jgi:hypothetical protein
MDQFFWNSIYTLNNSLNDKPLSILNGLHRLSLLKDHFHGSLLIGIITVSPSRIAFFANHP